MIDVHCHLEQHDYDKDRDELIKKLEKEMRALITCCAHPRDFNLTLNMVKKYKGFLFAVAGIHPGYVGDVDEEERSRFIEKIKMNRKLLVGIGEVGLDYRWVEEEKLRERQKNMFISFIQLADELKLPLVIHARNAFKDAVEILEENDAKNVLMHMFGSRELLQRVVKNGWFISVNASIFRSKTYKKITRDVPLENLMLETDSPWLHPEKVRNDPLTVKIVARKVAEIKKIDVEEVIETTDANAINFFNLSLER